LACYDEKQPPELGTFDRHFVVSPNDNGLSPDVKIRTAPFVLMMAVAHYATVRSSVRDATTIRPPGQKGRIA
jgi:hypothetical protein